MSDNLVADVQDSHTWYKGSGIIESIADVVVAIDEDRWVDALLAGFMTGLEGVGAYLDPIGTIASTGVSWLIEAVEPLRDYLTDLTGDADILTAHAQTWDNMAVEVQAIADELYSYIEADTSAWTGDAADAYRTMMSLNVSGTEGLAGLCSAMRAATEGAATLVTITRELVRDLIAELIATLLVRLPVWLGLIATGVGIPLVATQATGMVLNLVALLTGVIMALVQSFQALQALLDG
ncbi:MULTISPECIES: WXG100 family type VII secretion target [Glycomyces]|uniref:Uncharacterized protein YukE n=2 Tax=Glycomyces TaxID=58113 RepID=A0A9X3PGE7_9ACTN|nr:WXG100 family type VII secretion target [Glycomyces lechevalierae]MDA1384850.1 WXG100 family type VII secretion target [Glycomyces lechevalierae]MDR7337698.1 uncharacterized protein YukE [Glycomyces lechevalierae]